MNSNDRCGGEIVNCTDGTNRCSKCGAICDWSALPCQKPVVDRRREQANDPEKYDRMVKLLSAAGSKSDMERAAVMYIMDMSYARCDIALAVKSVETAKGW